MIVQSEDKTTDDDDDGDGSCGGFFSRALSLRLKPYLVVQLRSGMWDCTWLFSKDSIVISIRFINKVVVIHGLRLIIMGCAEKWFSFLHNGLFKMVDDY